MKWFWPLVILLSALAAGLVNFVYPDTLSRPFVMTWFLCVCPGMMLTRFFRLKEPMTEWTLAIALSFVIDAAIASVQMYASHWSPPTTLLIIMSICIVGGIVQILQVSTYKS